MAKFVTEDGEVTWRPWAPAMSAVTREDGTTEIVIKPLPPQKHHSITAQAFEPEKVYRAMEDMMSTFGANPARKYQPEENADGSAIKFNRLAFPGSNDKRTINLSKGQATPATLRPHWRPMTIIPLHPVRKPEPVLDGDADAEGATEEQPAGPPKPRFVLDAIELGFMPPATVQKFKKPEEEGQATQLTQLSTPSGQFGSMEPSAAADDTFVDTYDSSGQWGEDDDEDDEDEDDTMVGFEYEYEYGFDLEPEPEPEQYEYEFEHVAETPTRRGTRSNPAPEALAPTSASRLKKQLNGKGKGKDKAVPGANGSQPQRSRLSIVSYPTREVTPPEPRRTRSGLVVDMPAGPSRSRPIVSDPRVQAVQSEPKRTRSGLIIQQVPSPPPPSLPASGRRGRVNAARSPSPPQSTPRRTRSGMVIAPSPTSPPALSLHDESPPPTQTRRSGRYAPVEAEPAPRRKRSGIVEPPAGRSSRTAPGAQAAPVETRKTRSRRSPSIVEQAPTRAQQARNRQQQQRTAASNAVRKVAKPKAISRPIVSFANTARRLRSMRYNMSLRNPARGAKSKPADVPAKTGAASCAGPSKSAPRKSAAAQPVVVAESEEEYESEDDGGVVVELPMRKKQKTQSMAARHRAAGRDKAVVVLPIGPRKRMQLIEDGHYGEF